MDSGGQQLRFQDIPMSLMVAENTAAPLVNALPCPYPLVVVWMFQGSAAHFRVLYFNIFPSHLISQNCNEGFYLKKTSYRQAHQKSLRQSPYARAKYYEKAAF